MFSLFSENIALRILFWSFSCVDQGQINKHIIIIILTRNPCVKFLYIFPNIKEMGKRSSPSEKTSPSKRHEIDEVFSLKSMVANDFYFERFLQQATPSAVWTLHNTCQEWRKRLTARKMLIYECCVEWTRITIYNHRNLGKLLMIYNLFDAGYLTKEEYDICFHRLKFRLRILGSIDCTKILGTKPFQGATAELNFRAPHFVCLLYDHAHRGEAAPFAHLALDNLMAHGLCNKLLKWFLQHYLLFPNINIRRLITENALIKAQVPGHILQYCQNWANKKKLSSFRDLTKLPDVSGQHFFYLLKLKATYIISWQYFVMILMKSACRIPDKSDVEIQIKKQLITTLTAGNDRALVTKALEYLAVKYGKNFTDETLDALFSLDHHPTTFKTSSSQVIRVLLNRRPLSTSAICSFWHYIENYHTRHPKGNPFKKLPKIANYVVEQDLLPSLLNDLNNLDKTIRKTYCKLFNRLVLNYSHEKLRNSIEILVTRCAKGYEQEMLGHIYYPRQLPEEFLNWPVDISTESKGVIKYNFLVARFYGKHCFADTLDCGFILNSS